jgi:5-methylcytosine-specific restriction endonuclease McrA
MENRVMPARNRSGPATPFIWSKEWRALRLVALKRDGYRCTKCGADISGKGMARIDHVHPRRTHPHLALALANVRSLCAACDNRGHAEKGLPIHMRTGERTERVVGVDRSGLPLDPKHHWNK